MKRKLSFLLIFVIVLGFCSLTRYHINDQKVVFENFGLNKNCSLEEGVKAVEETEKIELFIKLNTLEFNDGQILRDNYTNKEYEEYRKVKREKAIKYFYNTNLKIFKKMGLSNYINLYVSKYGPFIEVSFDTSYFNQVALEILSNVSSLSDVGKIYVKEKNDQNIQNQLRNNFVFVGAGTIYEEREYTASGIKVGLLEYGIPDTDHVNFTNANVTTYDNPGFWDREVTHTTKMASIICGPNAAAQDCSLYSAYLVGTPVNEIEWMLDNDIDIVNMSYGETNPTGNYDSNSAYIDFISYTYGVVFVASVGNDGQESGNVCNPAMGYYVIGVGAITENGGIEDYTNVWDNDGPPKPTISTIGTLNIPNFNTINMGTSISCAFITSMLAMMMEQCPSLRGNPYRVLACMCANAEAMSLFTADTGSGFSEYVGAGIFRYDSMIENFNRAYVKTIIYNNIDSIIYTEEVNLTAGDEFAVAIAWKAVTDGTVNGINFTDYDLRLRDPNGNVLAVTTLNTSMIETARILSAPVTGTYTFEIVQRTNYVTFGEDIYMYWSINPSEV